MGTQVHLTPRLVLSLSLVLILLGACPLPHVFCRLRPTHELTFPWTMHKGDMSSGEGHFAA